MSKLKKIKDIDNYKPRFESIYETQKNLRQQALETAKNTSEEIKKPVKFDLKR